MPVLLSAVKDWFLFVYARRGHTIEVQIYRILNLALRCNVIGFQFVVTLCGFVIIGLAVSRFYRSEKHRDTTLYPRFGLDTFVYTIAMA